SVDLARNANAPDGFAERLLGNTETSPLTTTTFVALGSESVGNDNTHSRSCSSLPITYRCPAYIAAGSSSATLFGPWLLVLRATTDAAPARTSKINPRSPSAARIAIEPSGATIGRLFET